MYLHSTLTALMCLLLPFTCQMVTLSWFLPLWIQFLIDHGGDFHSRGQSMSNYCWQEHLLCTSKRCAVSLCPCLLEVKYQRMEPCLTSLSIRAKLKKGHNVQNQIPSFHVWDVFLHTSRQSMGPAGWNLSSQPISLFHWEACVRLIFIASTKKICWFMGG